MAQERLTRDTPAEIEITVWECGFVHPADWMEAHPCSREGECHGWNTRVVVNAGEGALIVAVRALREIRELRGQQGAEAVRMAESALVAMGKQP